MRQRVSLQFGAGLDRSSGFLAGAPERMADVRNVYPRNGKLEVRKGMTLASSLSGVDVVAGGGPLRPEQVGLVVGYDSTGRTLKVFRTDGTAGSPELLGTWFTLNASAEAPPRTFQAEQYDRVFFAHDELRFSYRGQTYYYDPADPDVLVGLTADLDGDGDAPIKFRGVVSFLDYLFGWGFGSASEDRPELLRPSLPGQPTVFEANRYATVGARGDPILSCLPGADSLLVFKAAETHEHFGYSADSFGVRPLDMRYGLAGSRLAVSVLGAVFGWSLEGPRIWQGGTSDDLSYPLDLKAPAPSDLVAEGATEDGFALYLPERRAIEFTFGQRVYTLHLWNRGSPEWTYQERDVEAHSGFLLYGGGTAKSIAPTGAPSFNSASNVTSSSAELLIDHSGQAGDEYLETWMYDGSSWSMADSRRVNALSQQTVEVDGLSAGVAYDLAVRYRRGTYYTSGYDGTPSTWPSYQASAVTALLDTPTLDSAVWSRVDASNEQIILTITPAHNEDVVITHAGTTVHTETAASHGGSQFTFTHTPSDPSSAMLPESWNAYDVYHDNGTIQSDPAEQSVWGGPEGAPTDFSVDAAVEKQHFLSWSGSGNGRDAEITGTNKTGPGTLSDTTTDPDHYYQHTGLTTGDAWLYYVREFETAFGVTDYTARTESILKVVL